MTFIKRTVKVYFPPDTIVNVNKFNKWINRCYEFGAKNVYDTAFDPELRILTIELNINPFKLKSTIFVDNTKI